ncbi:MAG TPA: hypothetical protein VK447_04825 [Myxococcaceae bacterium]|nr:hypothetical protein [Myxococcaceae bacterium]
MKKTISVLLVAAMFAAAGCTTVNTAKLQSDRSGRDIFVSAGDIPEPYDSLGLVQATRSGVRVFGFIDPMGTDIEAGLRDVLIPQVREMGGDGAINVRFHMTQYAPITQAVFAVLFFIPLPSQVVVSGEVVKLRRHGASPVVP